MKPIITNEEYESALKEIDSLMSAKKDTPEGKRLDELTALVETYEKEHIPMSTTYKYQEDFAHTLANEWRKGERSYVRSTLRRLKNKAQAAHISAVICWHFIHTHGDESQIDAFTAFIHPNNRD